MPNDPFQTISTDDLDTITGGRLITSKGPDPVVIQGIQTLVKTIGETGQALQASSAAQSNQMQGVMQQFMEKRKAGG